MGKQRPKSLIKIYGPPKKPAAWRNPLVWIAAAIVGFITSFLFFGGRDAPPDPSELIAEEQAAPDRNVEQPLNDLPQAERGSGPEQRVEEPARTASLEHNDAEPAARTTEGKEARGFIEEVRSHGNVQDLSAVFDRAGQFAAAGKQTDAYLLYFFAAREGHAPSAFVLGGLSDPNHYRQGANLASEPDPVQSLKWYRVAASDGYKDAQVRLQELQKWVEQRARAGDVRAQQLLLSFR